MMQIEQGHYEARMMSNIINNDYILSNKKYIGCYLRK